VSAFWLLNGVAAEHFALLGLGSLPMVAYKHCVPLGRVRVAFLNCEGSKN